jgi:hypothetical protein
MSVIVPDLCLPSRNQPRPERCDKFISVSRVGLRQGYAGMPLYDSERVPHAFFRTALPCHRVVQWPLGDSPGSFKRHWFLQSRKVSAVSHWVEPV